MLNFTSAWKTASSWKTVRAGKSPLPFGVPGNSLLQWWPPSLPMIGQTQTLIFPLFFLEMTSWTVGPHWPIWIKCRLVWVDQTLASPLPLGRNWTLMCPWTLECGITSSSLFNGKNQPTSGKIFPDQLPCHSTCSSCFPPLALPSLIDSSLQKKGLFFPTCEMLKTSWLEYSPYHKFCAHPLPASVIAPSPYRNNPFE